MIFYSRAASIERSEFTYYDIQNMKHNFKENMLVALKLIERKFFGRKFIWALL